jgi:uncharacterized alpha-E superfamily protein
MMLARVADSLYWIGRYVERAEHVCRLSDVMLNATLDRTEAAAQVAQIALSAIGDPGGLRDLAPYDAALNLALDRENNGSVTTSIMRARENARQVRDQITTETWERLNLIYLRVSAPGARKAFASGSSAFLSEIIADLHLFKGAADATMSHGEGWRFLLLGIHLERAQLIARLLRVCFAPSEQGPITDHLALTSLLRMSCALEPYLRRYTAEIQPKLILEFLMFDEEFPRSVRFSTTRIEEHLTGAARYVEHAANAGPERLAGRLNARLRFADVENLELRDAGLLLDTVLDECAAVHSAIYDTFVAYSLEMRLPA